MGESKRELWAKRVERWKDSGLTATEFAAEVGVNAHTLSWWAWRLRAAGASEATTSKPPPRRAAALAKAKPAEVSPLTFVEMTAALGGDRLELVLPSSVRVVVRPGFDSATLAQLLDVLEARR